MWMCCGGDGSGAADVRGLGGGCEIWMWWGRWWWCTFYSFSSAPSTAPSPPSVLCGILNISLPYPTCHTRLSHPLHSYCLQVKLANTTGYFYACFSTFTEPLNGGKNTTSIPYVLIYAHYCERLWRNHDIYVFFFVCGLVPCYLKHDFCIADSYGDGMKIWMFVHFMCI